MFAKNWRIAWCGKKPPISCQRVGVECREEIVFPLRSSNNNDNNTFIIMLQ